MVSFYCGGSDKKIIFQAVLGAPQLDDQGRDQLIRIRSLAHVQTLFVWKRDMWVSKRLGPGKLPVYPVGYPAYILPGNLPRRQHLG